ncbi:MAG TPA: LytTR family DNA-binding domain-containing protein [Leadbetterella sp.]|nr:LytTR family DNA-binding domain-containing protein [Leadbetterella sp.]
MVNLNAKTKVDPEDVVWVEGHVNYSKIYLKNHETIFLAMTLKKVVDKFDSDSFCRIHRSQLVNLSYLSRFEITSNGLRFRDKCLPISRRRRDDFLRRTRNI